MTVKVTLLDQAKRDLRRMGPGPERKRVVAGLQRLGVEDEALDVKVLQGSPGWFRLRIGDHRAMYRVVEGGRDREYFVRRVVHRRDLEAAVASLPGP